jgi:energy-converting hydrogenase Eha subunit B
MRLPLLLVCLLLLARPASAQFPADSLHRQEAPTVSPTAFAAERARLDQRGLTVLGGWALGNLLVSGIATGQTEGPAHYFHQMNSGWGAINLALAGVGYLGARRAADQPAPDRAGNVRAQLRTENLYLFNAGLDVAYLATGVYLLEKGRNPTAPGSADRWRGYGQSLLLQGGFLLLFDGFQYATHHRHGTRALYPLLSRISIGPGTMALVLPLGNAVRRPVSLIRFQ